MKYINDKKNKKKGFTLIEIMVSVAIFSIIITAGMGALMTVLGAHRFAQNEKKSSDAIGYVLENVTREIRLGYDYYALPESLDDPLIDKYDNGMGEMTEGNLIGFSASDNRGYIFFYIKDGVLYKRHFEPNLTDYVDNSLSDKSQIIIERARITVLNAENDDQRQPMVWLQFRVAVPGQDSIKVIQTLVSQRTLDVPANI